jgi:hypothetical protein
MTVSICSSVTLLSASILALIACSCLQVVVSGSGWCSEEHEGQGSCLRSYQAFCSDSFETIDKLLKSLETDPADFTLRAWEWVEAAGICVYAMDKHNISLPSASSSLHLFEQLVSVLRMVLATDRSAAQPPPGACHKLIWKRKSFVKSFLAAVNGGIHPALKLRVRPHFASAEN